MHLYLLGVLAVVAVVVVDDVCVAQNPFLPFGQVQNQNPIRSGLTNDPNMNEQGNPIWSSWAYQGGRVREVARPLWHPPSSSWQWGYGDGRSGSWSPQPWYTEDRNPSQSWSPVMPGDQYLSGSQPATQKPVAHWPHPMGMWTSWRGGPILNVWKPRNITSWSPTPWDNWQPLGDRLILYLSNGTRIDPNANGTSITRNANKENDKPNDNAPANNNAGTNDAGPN